MLTLILPIGGPGSGKTTLCQNLKKGIIPDLLQKWVKIEDTFTYSCRDELYAIVRKDNGSRATRRILYDMFLKWIAQIQEQRLQGKSVIAYLDSVNSQLGGRKHIIEQIKPDKVIFINFRVPMEILIQRTMVRKCHPTFPGLEEEQKEIIRKVLSGLEFAGNEDIVSGSEIILEKPI